MPMNIQSVSQKLLGGERLIFSCLAESFEAFLVAEVIRSLRKSREGEPVVLVHVARDGKRARAFLETLAFIDPEIESLHFPGWDCQPYDRISPHGDILAQRMLALSRLERSRSSAEKPRILSTTANALLQRVPPRQWVRQTSFSAARGNHVNREELLKWLDGNGFNRVSTVRDIGEYAVRGGIVDVSPPGQPFPARLDFLGDMLETIRHFNPETQRTERHIGSLDLVPTNEAYLTHESIRAFRQNYIGAFGLPSPGSDPLYESVSEGRAFPGMEHWVPLFHPKMDSLFDYFGAAPILLDYDIEGAVGSHLSHIQDYYEARQQAYEVNPRKANYKPLPPLALYLSQEEWETYVSCSGHAYFSSASDESLTKKEQYIFSCGVQLGRSFEQERAQSSLPGEATEEGESPRPNVFSALVAYIKQLQAKRKQVILASGSDGARERLASILAEQKVKPVEFISSFSQMSKEGKQPVSLVVLPLERGFETEDFALISEQDVLGERFLRNAPRRARPKNFLQAISSLEPMDLVVHVSHGIGRFIGLQRIEAMRVPHDCLEIHYAGGDKLFLPVENLDLLARYGSAETEVTLDRLGGDRVAKPKSSNADAHSRNGA